MWKVIQHIRYCELFYDTNDVAGLKERLGFLKTEFNSILSKAEAMKFIINFVGSNRLRQILKKMVQSEDAVVSSVAAEILIGLSKEKQ